MRKGLAIFLAIFIFGISISCSENDRNSPKEPLTTECVTDEVANTTVFNQESVTSISIDKLYFPLPEKYRYYISSEQGLRASIPNVNAGGGATSSTYHNAIDFAVPDKTPVYAAKSGYVKTVYPSYYNGEIWKGHPTYGGLIEIAHTDGTTTLYAHLSYTEVREGDYVEAKQEIGWSGGKKGRRGSGNSTGPHLHFSEYVDINNQFM